MQAADLHRVVWDEEEKRQNRSDDLGAVVGKNQKIQQLACQDHNNAKKLPIPKLGAGGSPIWVRVVLETSGHRL